MILERERFFQGPRKPTLRPQLNLKRWKSKKVISRFPSTLHLQCNFQMQGHWLSMLPRLLRWLQQRNFKGPMYFGCLIFMLVLITFAMMGSILLPRYQVRYQTADRLSPLALVFLQFLQPRTPFMNLFPPGRFWKPDSMKSNLPRMMPWWK